MDKKYCHDNLDCFIECRNYNVDKIMTNMNKTIKELVKAGFTEEQAVLLALRFVNEKNPQEYSVASAICEIRELKLWLINNFGELNREIIKTRTELKYNWRNWVPVVIPFIIPFIVVVLIVYLKTRI